MLAFQRLVEKCILQKLCVWSEFSDFRDFQNAFGAFLGHKMGPRKELLTFCLKAVAFPILDSIFGIVLGGMQARKKN